MTKVLTDSLGKVLVSNGEAFMQPTPTGNINITDTNITDVADYATAQVVDADLVPDNIKKDVNILGVVGTLESGEETFWSDYGAKYTKNMVFPAGINIAGYLYQDTTNLESVEFDGAVSIGAYAFNNASGLTGSVMDIKTSIISNYSFQKTYLSKLICGTSSLTQSGIRGINDRGTGNLTIKLLKTCTNILNYNFFSNPNTTIDLTDFDVDDDVPTITSGQQLMNSYVFKNQATLEKFASATNWSAWSANFVVASEGGNV